MNFYFYQNASLYTTPKSKGILMLLLDDTSDPWNMT